MSERPSDFEMTPALNDLLTYLRAMNPILDAINGEYINKTRPPLPEYLVDLIITLAHTGVKIETELESKPTSAPSQPAAPEL